MSAPGPSMLKSPSGLAVQVNANGSIRRMDLGDIVVNLFVGNEMEGAAGNVFLRRLRGPAVESTPLLGPCSAPIFVDDSAPPGGDGASWATAFDDLHAGLAAAAQRRDDGCRQAPIEVWVAEGVYRPAPAGGPRGVAFEMGGGIALYGGFAGNETCRFERDPRVSLRARVGAQDHAA